MENNITLGEIVTWGSGAPMAEVVMLSPDGKASLILAADLKTPCGRTFLKGMSLTMPLSELRTVLSMPTSEEC